MNWGYKIILAFTLFGALMVGMVVISMRQDINLVAEDYYEQELNFQSRIDAMENVRKLDSVPEIYINEGQLVIDYLNIPSEFSHGTLTLHSPISNKYDSQWEFSTDKLPNFKLDTSALKKGYWKAQLEWHAGGLTYYIEKEIKI